MNYEKMYDLVSTKFNLTEEEFKNLKVGLSQIKSHIEPSILDSFFSLEDAEKTLEKFNNSYQEIIDTDKVEYIYTEVYIQENYYDDDYYFINFGEILKYADGLKKRG